MVMHYAQMVCTNGNLKMFLSIYDVLQTYPQLLFVTVLKFCQSSSHFNLRHSTQQNTAVACSVLQKLFLKFIRIDLAVISNQPVNSVILQNTTCTIINSFNAFQRFISPMTNGYTPAYNCNTRKISTASVNLSADCSQNEKQALTKDTLSAL